MTDVWVFENSPAPISGERDDGNLPFNFEPPERGGHLRSCAWPGSIPARPLLAALQTAAHYGLCDLGRLELNLEK